MKPLFDAVALTVMKNMARAINLYCWGGAIGLFLGGTAWILSSQTRRKSRRRPTGDHAAVA
jgi:hypothetical protein